MQYLKRQWLRTFQNNERHQLTEFRVSANPSRDKYIENHTGAQYSRIAENLQKQTQKNYTLPSKGNSETDS